ncbi:MAG: S8 family serine peptidase [Bacteroidota bacterium]
MILSIRHIALLLGLLVLFSTNTQAQEFKAGELLVQLQNDAQISDLTASPLSRSANAGAFSIKKTIYEPFGIYLLSFDPLRYDIHEMLRFLRSHPSVESAQLNFRAELRGTTPNDLFFDNQWYLNKIDAPDAWDITTGGVTVNGDTIVVAVIDGGCSTQHEDLVNNIWFNKAEIPNDGIDNDNNGYVDDYYGLNVKTSNDSHPDASHGCAVSGIIGAEGDNEQGTVGINWQTKMMLISGSEYTDEIVEAYTYALDMRKKYNETDGREGAFVAVTNYSAGIDRSFCEDFPIWGSIYDSLGCAGIINIGATTNKDFNVDVVGDMPTTCPSEFLIAVTSTDRQDRKLTNAGYGPINIDLAAPGLDIFSAKARSDYGEIGDGTSFATPMVAGAIALMYSLPSTELGNLISSNPKEAARCMREVILSGVEVSPSLVDQVETSGRLNLFRSILELQSKFGGKSGPLGICEIRPNLATSGDRVEVIFQKPDLNAYDIRIYDAAGKYVIGGKIQAGLSRRSFFIENLENWAPGVYFVTIQNNLNITTSRFVVY